MASFQKGCKEYFDAAAKNLFEKSVEKPATLPAGPPFLWRVSLAYGNFLRSARHTDGESALCVAEDRRGERLFEKMVLRSRVNKFR